MKTENLKLSNQRSSLGLNVKLYRSQRNMSQKDLSELLGVSVNYLSLIEGSKKYPSLKVIFKIAEVLNVSPSDLLEDDPLQDELSILTNKYDLDSIIKKLNKIANIENKEDCQKNHCLINC